MENKKIGISLVTILLIIAICIIGVLSYMLYKSNTKTIQASSEKTELKDKLQKVEFMIENNEKRKEEKEAYKRTYESLVGYYEEEDSNEDGYVRSLTLLDDGTFYYKVMEMTPGGYTGYYTFDGDHTIILHCIIENGGDISCSIVNETITVIYEGESLLEDRFDMELQKKDRDPKTTVDFDQNIISTHLINSLKAEAVYYDGPEEDQ